MDQDERITDCAALIRVEADSEVGVYVDGLKRHKLPTLETKQMIDCCRRQRPVTSASASTGYDQSWGSGDFDCSG